VLLRNEFGRVQVQLRIVSRKLVEHLLRGFLHWPIVEFVKFGKQRAPVCIIPALTVEVVVILNRLTTNIAHFRSTSAFHLGNHSI